MVIWLIGMSAAGKTTVGKALHRMWKRHEECVVFVDGDEVRSLFSQVPHADPYGLEGRRANAERMTELCAWLDRQGIHVVCSILSVFDDMRLRNREHFTSYYEVYLRAPMEVLVRRDRKDLYLPALRGERSNVVGVDLPFDEPTRPDLVLENGDEPESPERLAATILAEAGLVTEAVCEPS